MTKQQLIDAIRDHNRSATSEYLDAFDAPALNEYLNHLRYGLEPRGRDSIWTRSGATTAIVVRIA